MKKTKQTPPEAIESERDITEGRPSYVEIVRAPARDTRLLVNLSSADAVLNSDEEAGGRPWDLKNGEIFLGSQYFEPDGVLSDTQEDQEAAAHQEDVDYMRGLVGQLGESDALSRSLGGKIGRFDAVAAGELIAYAKKHSNLRTVSGTRKRASSPSGGGTRLRSIKTIDVSEDDQTN